MPRLNVGGLYNDAPCKSRGSTHCDWKQSRASARDYIDPPSCGIVGGLMKYRHRVLGLLILLFAITYIDRVAISVAGPRMQEELGIDPVGWGWVTAMFTLSYCIFEVPTGTLGDRIGPRRVLTRVVLWWSAFTSLTGLVSSYRLLLLTRFCFGAGEAGAFPNASIVASRWFPKTQRASISGVMLMASQIGGGVAPLLVVPIQIRYGWRASFYVFGIVGAVWAVAWYWWFRDSPAEKPGVTEAELREINSEPALHSHGFPWRKALASETVLAMLGTAFCYVYVYNFFQTWFHTFLVKGRGFSEGSALLIGALEPPGRTARGGQGHLAGVRHPVAVGQEVSDELGVGCLRIEIHVVERPGARVEQADVGPDRQRIPHHGDVTTARWRPRGGAARQGCAA